MKNTILLTAPYMIPFLDRFRPVLEKYGFELIVPNVQERMEEGDLLQYASKFDGAICGDDRYTARVLEACSPRLKVISKWGVKNKNKTLFENYQLTNFNCLWNWV